MESKSIVQVAARHNHREIFSEFGVSNESHIDPTRIILNRILHGPATAQLVAAEAKMRMTEAGVERLKKTAVMAVEIVFSLPPRSTINSDLFFSQAVKWAADHFNVPILRAIVHNDESAPHCHVILLPLVAGKMRGSDLVGGPGKMRSHQAAFHAQVAEKHGLQRQTPQKGHSARVRRAAAQVALDVLRDNGELCATSDAVMNELLELISANPAKLLAAMGRTMPVPSAKLSDTFVGIMTRPTKPVSKPALNPKGVGRFVAVKSELAHSSEAIGIPVPAHPPTAEFQPKKSSPTLSCVGNRVQGTAMAQGAGSQTRKYALWSETGSAVVQSPASLSSKSTGNNVPVSRAPRGSYTVGESSAGVDSLNLSNTEAHPKSQYERRKFPHEFHKRQTTSGSQVENEGSWRYTPVGICPSRFGCLSEARTQASRMPWTNPRASAFGLEKKPP
jgi:hypothetical protein